ncbi:MAG: ABC transporter substrate-binding protein, partial [Spirochaetes bacterium]|nr:ABC transporter substrate-binding protein [Spirochaetota bacterium]
PTCVYSPSVFRCYTALSHRIAKRTLPAPGNWDFIHIEKIISLQPDVVIVWAQQEDAIAALRQRGIAVYGVMLRSIDDVYQEIRDFGKLTGKEKRAQILIDYAQRDVMSITALVKSVSTRPRVYFMWAQGITETSGKGSTVDDLISLAGGTNIFSTTLLEHMVVNLEQIIVRDPHIIVMWHNERMNPHDIIFDSRLKTVSAVKDGRVFELPDVFLCDMWTLKFIYAARLMASWFHPTLFDSQKLGAQKNSILEFLYGRKIQ